MADLSLCRLGAVFDLRQKLRLDPDALVRDPLWVGLGLADQWFQPPLEVGGRGLVEAVVCLRKNRSVSFDRSLAFATLQNSFEIVRSRRTRVQVRSARISLVASRRLAPAARSAFRFAFNLQRSRNGVLVRVFIWPNRSLLGTRIPFRLAPSGSSFLVARDQEVS
jgi:hypothetical protein